MSQRGQRARGRARKSAHAELEPTRRLIVIETARATVVAALLGCAAALVLDTLGMLVTGALLGDAATTPERLGRGILAAASVGIVVLALLAGVLATAGRFAVADLYARAAADDPRVADTVLVRGQASPSPADPALASVAGVGGLAVLAAIPCIVLAAEHAGRLDDDLHRTEFASWLNWALALIAIVLLSAGSMLWLAAVNRRWAAGRGARLPRGTTGQSGPRVRTTTRASRRAARRSWGPLDWTGSASGALVAIGAGLVFLGVFLHQPGLYATPVRYDADIEGMIAVVTVVGGVLAVVGLLLAIACGGITTSRTIRAVRRAVDEPRSVTDTDRRLVRAATTSLSDSITTAQAGWAAVAVVAAGWWFAARVDTPADADGSALADPTTGVGGLLLLLLWVLCGAALIGARAALQAKGPGLRNRFGYVLPSEADDREFPDLPLFGQ